MYCQHCGTEHSPTATACPQCGHVIKSYRQKSRAAAVLLALFLGSIGVHRFYLGDHGIGALYAIGFIVGLAFPLLTVIVVFCALLDALVLLVRRGEFYKREVVV